MDQPHATYDMIPEAPDAPPMSLASRLFNVFATPGEVFESIRGWPHSVANWLVPALLAVIVGWIGSVWVLSQDSVKQQMAELSEKGVQKQIERMKASPEQAEQMRAAAEKFGGIMQKAMAFVAPPFMAFTSPFIWGFFLWLAAKGMKAPIGYMKGVEVVGLSNMIGVLDGVIRTLMIVVLGNLWAGPHPGMLLPHYDPQNPAHGVLAALSIMTFWLLAVRSVGLAKLTGGTFGKAAAWVFGIWLTYTSVFLGIGFVTQAIFNR